MKKFNLLLQKEKLRVKLTFNVLRIINFFFFMDKIIMLLSTEEYLNKYIRSYYSATNDKDNNEWLMNGPGGNKPPVLRFK